MEPLHSQVHEEIEEVRQGRRKILDLNPWVTDRPLTEIPEEVFELLHLEELDLVGNHIRVIPERIRNLPNLRRLYLQRNPIEEVPDIPGLALDWPAYLRCRRSLSPQHIFGIWINAQEEAAEASRLVPDLANLPDLRFLYIGLGSISSDERIPSPSASVSNLISAVGKLCHLESLRFFAVSLGDIPPSIRNLKKLQFLTLAFTRLGRVPGWLSELEELTELGLGNNELRALPDSLAHLSRLKTLYLNDNRFAKIPEVVFSMRALAHLDFSYDHNWNKSNGRIKKIPAEILHLANLESFSIAGQPIEIPPAEVVTKGLEAIKNYWRQQQEVGIDYLCEAKLIIVGEAGAGKTTLAEKIRDPHYELQPEQRSTEGIEVIRWSFPAAVHVKRDGGDELLQRDFKVNVWDFGGQEVYHATHQFFLTRRSLYALVADDRKEDTDFNYWLQVVELLSDRSPLLIVQNEKQDRQRDIDFGGLRARFPHLREAYRINLATNRGLETLVTAIRQELERLPHIGTPLPKTWNRVRAALEKDPRDYISLEEYLAICEKHGFARREDKLQLSGYLHDLGICLHFQNDPVLKNTVILKPKWGTGAVYRVLDDHAVLDQRGRFGPEDLARIWAEETYAPMRDELLRLMMKFQLCYQLPDHEAYIAPQLLSPTRPSYEWDSRGNLVLRYEYEFMPKGLITRFIVAVNHLIADPVLVWKSGVILEREDTRAEVIEDYSRRKIVVRVSGPDTRALLAIVDDQLERIHSSFARLKYDRLLPCNCEVCRQLSEPAAFSLSELKDFAQHGDKIQCRTSRKLVDAVTLIRDVFPRGLYVLEPQGRTELLRHQDAGLAEPAPRKKVFVSYAWTPESKAIVDRLEEAFKGRDITLLRDRNEIKYKESIREFMKRIGQGKCIVVVLSKKYLESKSCMFELTEVAARGEIRNRVFPIVLKDAEIYDALGRLDYIEHWEKKIKELDARMKGVSAANLQGIREELDLYDKIRDTVAGIVDILGDMNALTPEQHEGTGFEEMLRALQARLAE